jgi:myo-inositol-1(or 4)-monophosphatase
LYKSFALKKFIFFLKNELTKINSDYTADKQNFRKKKNKKFDIVTNLDIKIEKFLRAEIKKKFPTHNLHGEELKNKNNNSKYTWFIDPIDGTKNMVLGLPTWSNMIGLVYQSNKGLISLINYPVLNKFYFSFNSKSFLHEKNKIRLIRSSGVTSLQKAKIAINTINTLKNAKIFKYFLNFKGFFKITGADSYNFCLIADGKLDVLVEDCLKTVDIMPLLALVENSGAVITDWKGKKNFTSGKILVTSNMILNKKMVRILN